MKSKFDASLVRFLLEQAQEAVNSLNENIGDIIRVSDLLIGTLNDDRNCKIFLCGNGGSAADAQHMAAELVGRFSAERRALPAIALTTDTSAVTAIANDFGYETVFERQIEALGRAGDSLIVFSTSGRSRNVIRAAQAANARGMTVISLVGSGAMDAILRKMSTAVIQVRSSDTPRIQECHTLIAHIICHLIDEDFRHKKSLKVDPPVDAVPTVGKKVMCLEEAVKWRLDQRAARREVAFVNGTFDILHAGHIELLRQARRDGRAVIVGINSDESTRMNKGPLRPIMSCQDRIRCLEDLSTVDVIIPFDEKDPRKILTGLVPDVIIKGSDYAPPSSKKILEQQLVEYYGGTFEFVERQPEHASSKIISAIGRAFIEAVEE